MSILLGPLASNKGQEIQSIYNTNFEDQIKKIEQHQIGQNFQKPEFLRQFDDLTFDTISNPVGVNECNVTITGVNSSLQRNLDFQRGYSEFQENDMHYDVVSKDQFTHNNMTFGTRRRDFPQSSVRGQRSLELFTGIDSNYVPKKEKVPLFQPMSDLTWVNGVPSVTSSGELQKRFIASNKNNCGNLPFEYGVKVAPGVDFKNQAGTYAVYRVDPRNVDELRSEINRKVSYENKPLETCKMGDIRANDFTLSKFKKPDFRVQHTTDFVPTRAELSAGYKKGKYTNVITQRNEEQTYLFGPAAATVRGDGPDMGKTKFEPAKRENYLNDNTHAVTGVTMKPVMTNIESFTNYETQRASTSTDMTAATTGSHYIAAPTQYTDMARDTIRQTTSAELIGTTTSNTNNKATNVMLTQQARDTIRQTTSAELIGTTTNNTSNKATNVLLTDMARKTIRQDTSAELVGATTNNTSNKATNVLLTDMARKTIRQDTSAELIGATTNNTSNKATNVLLTDMARKTIRQDTSAEFIGTTTNNTSNKATNVLLTDMARKTIRQDTSAELIGATTNNTSNKATNLIYTQSAKPTIRESTTCNIIAATTANTSNKATNLMLTDDARTTIRQQTELNNYISNTNMSDAGTYVRDLIDRAKDTIRQQTELTQYIGHANRDGESSYVRDDNDIAKPTIRESTTVQTPGMNVSNVNNGSYALDCNDIARTTVKETTLLEDYLGVATGVLENKKISHEAADNMTIDERREISTYNRPANGRADWGGPYINRETVHLNNPTLYSYIPAPGKALDNAVMPRACNPELKKEEWGLDSATIVQHVNSNGRPSISTSSYLITNDRINTLANNPLVNDIYHQKNY